MLRRWEVARAGVRSGVRRLWSVVREELESSGAVERSFDAIVVVGKVTGRGRGRGVDI
jgi:hypothetical protein